MKAIHLKKPKEVSIKEVEYPQRKSNEVLIKVKAVGICGSDVGAYNGINPMVIYPRILGHEIVPYIYCGHCYPCSIGRTNCCANMKVLGVHRL